MTRRGPHGLVRLGACFFEVLPETRDLILSGYYEHEERSAIRSYLPPELPVIELGASQGVLSCVTNRLLRDRSRHIVVEANPSLLPLLARNRDRNRCRFEIVHAVAGVATGTVDFFCDTNPLKSSLFVSSAKPCPVPVMTLGELLHARGFRDCTLICDIEGAEIGLIEGSIQLLKDHFQVLIVEFHPFITGAWAITPRRSRGFIGVGSNRSRERDTFTFCER